MGTLESVCSPSEVRLDHIADAEINELPFADRLDALGDAQFNRFAFATLSDALEDACYRMQFKMRASGCPFNPSGEHLR